MSEKRELGKVSTVTLGLGRGTFLTLDLGINFGSSFQNFGGIALCTWDEKRKRRVGTAPGADYIMQILNLFKVEDLNDIKGRTVWVERKDGGWGSHIEAIEIPAHDGGGRFSVEAWRKEWGYDKS